MVLSTQAQADKKKDNLLKRYFINNKYIGFEIHGGKWGNWWWWTPYTKRFVIAGWFFLNPLRPISTIKFFVRYWRRIPRV